MLKDAGGPRLTAEGKARIMQRREEVVDKIKPLEVKKRKLASSESVK